MMKTKRNLITGEPLLHAPGRGTRPHAFGFDPTHPLCPFCPGNEALTPPPSATLPSGDAWTARSFPNKYPASENHEVIVESPDHTARYASLEDAPAVLQLSIERYADLKRTPGTEHVTLFKNHGPLAGASIQHPHSQLLGVPFVPPRIEREARALANRSSCPLCQLTRETLRGEHWIRESEDFVWLAPEASWMPHQQWIVPREHREDMTVLGAAAVEQLALLLHDSSEAMRPIAPSFNWMFMNFPSGSGAHFYVDVFPRRTPIAGFELATGTFIEVVEAADTARAMKRN